MLFGAFTFITIIPVLICQWIGVIFLRKAGRGLEWWFMIVGTAITTLGSVATPFAIYFMTMASGNFQVYQTLMIGVGAFSVLGSLAFAIGFAIHGSKSSRRQDRIAELEMLSLAQATELQRLRDP